MKKSNFREITTITKIDDPNSLMNPYDAYIYLANGQMAVAMDIENRDELKVNDKVLVSNYINLYSRHVCNLEKYNK